MIVSAMCGRDMLANFFKHWYLGMLHGHGRKQENTFLRFPKARANKKRLQSIAGMHIFSFFSFFDSISFLFRERKNTSTILEKGKTNFKHAFSTLSKKHAFSFWLRIRNVQTKRMKQLTESERIEKEFGMWVWRGVAPWTWPKATKYFFVFSKSKSTTRKNCNQFLTKVKSSQYFHIRFLLFVGAI